MGQGRDRSPRTGVRLAGRPLRDGPDPRVCIYAAAFTRIFNDARTCG
jgi:hypothetical protein